MAPSRHKKLMRDSMVTNSFFNQVGGGICSCCLNNSHNHATESLHSDDPDHSQLAETGRGKDPLKCSVTKINNRTGDTTFGIEMTSIWSENFNNLTPEEYQRMQASMKMQPPISNPSEALKLAHKQMIDDAGTADQFPSIDTFDLDNLDEVAKTYDHLSKMYKDKEEHEMADLAGLIGDLAVTASDAKRPSEDRLRAELDMQILNIHSKITVPLKSCLRQVQLFNIEKRFGFVEESYQALRNDDEKQHGEDVPAELPLSFRQKLNNPFKPTEPTLKSSKKKQKKKLSGVKALTELQRNCKLAMEEMQELKKTISDAEKPIELPSMPASFTYQNVPVPEDIPDHIRQRFFDGDFAHEEVLVLQEKAHKELLRVRSAFAAWYHAGDEVWYVQFEPIPSYIVLRSEAHETSSVRKARFAL